MRIFYFHFGLLPDEKEGSIGGANRHVIEVLNKLSRRGHDVVLFTGGRDREIEYLEVDEIEFYGVNIFSSLSITSFVLPLLRCMYLMVGKIIAESRPDIIYTREMPYTAHTSLVAKIFNIPHLIEINGFLPECVPQERGYKPWHYPVLILMEGINYWLATKIISVSKSAKKRVCSFYNLDEKKVHWIRNGTDPDRLKPMDSEKCKEQVGLDPHKQYVGFVGSFFRYSGLEYFVKAASKVLDRIESVGFVLVGDGDIEEEIKNMIQARDLSDHFYLPGHVPWDRVPVFINAFDVCVNPRRDSGQSGDPLKTYEYMSCGKPIVASDVGELKELIEGNKAGFCFNPGDNEAFAAKVLNILENDGLRYRMGNNAREAILSQHAWEHTVDGVENVIKALAN